MTKKKLHKKRLTPKNYLIGLGNKVVPPIKKEKVHKHSYIYDKNYGESFCRICGKWRHQIEGY
jgi:hypothetical protein